MKIWWGPGELKLTVMLGNESVEGMVFDVLVYTLW